MNDSNNIRNIAVLGHQGSGKTSLVEALYGLVNNCPKGSVDKKTSISDYLKEEKLKLSSVSTSVIPLNYEGYKINLLDLPGNDDFIQEAISITHSIKGAVLVIDAAYKVQVGTIKYFNLLRKRNIPTIIYVNKMDKGNPSYESLYEDIVAHFGKVCVPFTLPLGHNDEFDGFINCVDLKARKYNGTECVDDIIHDDKKVKVVEMYNTICEAVAMTDDSLLDKFFSGEPLSRDEIHHGLRKGVLNGELVPVLFGSAEKNIGLHTMLDMFINYLPNPTDLKPYIGFNEKEEEIVRKTSVGEPFSAYVIKTIVDPYVGSINIIKIDSGVLKLGDEVYCPQLKQSLKINSLFEMCGKTQTPVTKVIAGDICAIGKLEDVETSFTLCDKANYICYKQVKFPTAVSFKAISVESKKDEEKLGPVLAKIRKEDPSIEVKRNVETHQLLLGGLSETHVQFIIDKIESNYEIKLNIAEPLISYRETITAEAKAVGKCVKQSGGSGLFGIVEMKFEPAEENIFTEEVFGGSVPKQYIPDVEKGFFEAVNEGQLVGCPVIGVHATLLDGKSHPVDSKNLAFKLASIAAFKEAYMHCKPTLLEPILRITINMDKKYMGDVLGDLTSRRGKVLDVIDKEDEIMQIVALIPESESLDYVTKLRALTQGSGFFNREFYEYQQVPEHIQSRLVKELAKKE